MNSSARVNTIQRLRQVLYKLNTKELDILNQKTIFSCLGYSTFIVYYFYTNKFIKIFQETDMNNDYYRSNNNNQSYTTINNLGQPTTVVNGHVDRISKHQ